MPSLTHPLQHLPGTILTDALKTHDEKVSIDGRNIINLRFANDIEALAEEKQN